MTWKTFFSPALKIAGGRALLLGAAGLALCIVCATFSQWHAHGLLHYGPAPNPADVWWVLLVEYLVIWLVPAAIFYGLGAWLSSSRVRAIDVFGTAAFALLPLVVMNLWHLLPGVGEIWSRFNRELLEGVTQGVTGGTPDAGAMLETLTRPMFWIDVVISVVVIVLMVVWLFNAVRVSCNLKGGRLWATYLMGLLIGDMICRIVISTIYTALYNAAQ